MELNELFGERPSALPASAALRVSAVRHRPATCVDRPAAGSQWATGVGEGTTVAVAARSLELLADPRRVNQGTSVSFGLDVPTVVQQAQTIHSTTSKQIQTKQINVASMYRVGGVGGAPPRGRPD